MLGCHVRTESCHPFEARSRCDVDDAARAAFPHVPELECHAIADAGQIDCDVCIPCFIGKVGEWAARAQHPRAVYRAVESPEPLDDRPYHARYLLLIADIDGNGICNAAHR